jgi:hypothetical protein
VVSIQESVCSHDIMTDPVGIPSALYMMRDLSGHSIKGIGTEVREEPRERGGLGRFDSDSLAGRLQRWASFIEALCSHGAVRLVANQSPWLVPPHGASVSVGVGLFV